MIWEINIGEFVDLERKYCYDIDIHQVCLRCQYKCKRKYTTWYGMLPDTEYCEYFEISPFWEFISDYMSENLEGN